MSEKAHLEPGVMANVVDIVVYADGIKLVFGDSPDGTERNAEHLGSYYLTSATAARLGGMLTEVFVRRNAAANARENDRQGADEEHKPTG